MIDLNGMNLDHDFYVLLVNNVVQKMRTRVTNTISLYPLLFICFKLLLSFKHNKIFLDK